MLFGPARWRGGSAFAVSAVSSSFGGCLARLGFDRTGRIAPLAISLETFERASPSCSTTGGAVDGVHSSAAVRLSLLLLCSSCSNNRRMGSIEHGPRCSAPDEVGMECTAGRLTALPPARTIGE